MFIIYIHWNRVYCAIMVNDHLAPFGNREKSTRTSHFYHQNSSSFEKMDVSIYGEKSIRNNE